MYQVVRQSNIPAYTEAVAILPARYDDKGGALRLIEEWTHDLIERYEYILVTWTPAGVVFDLPEGMLSYVIVPV